jgi:hypothetical protein
VLSFHFQIPDYRLVRPYIWKEPVSNLVCEVTNIWADTLTEPVCFNGGEGDVLVAVSMPFAI